MERPEPVNLVIPPNNTCIMIIPTPTSSQMATGREDLCICGFVIVAAKLIIRPPRFGLFDFISEIADILFLKFD